MFLVCLVVTVCGINITEVNGGVNFFLIYFERFQAMPFQPPRRQKHQVFQWFEPDLTTKTQRHQEKMFQFRHTCFNHQDTKAQRTTAKIINLVSW
jgi:hypothetical protein